MRLQSDIRNAVGKLLGGVLCIWYVLMCANNCVFDVCSCGSECRKLSSTVANKPSKECVIRVCRAESSMDRVYPYLRFLFQQNNLIDLFGGVLL